MYATRLGFSWNPVDWFESGVNLAESVFEPGAGGSVVTTDAQAAGVVSQWVAQVKGAGGIPTRMPLQFPNGGQLCARILGAGTSQPNAQPPVNANWYVLAPANVRAVDATATPTTAQVILNYLGSNLADFGGLGDGSGLTDQLKQYAIYGGIALAALLVLPVVIRELEGR